MMKEMERHCGLPKKRLSLSRIGPYLEHYK